MQRAGIKGSREGNKVKISKLKGWLCTCKAIGRPQRLMILGEQ